MRSIRQIYKIGTGPSSSHSMAPRRAAMIFLAGDTGRISDRVEIELYGSLAATGRGHLTDQVLHEVLGDMPHEIIWKPAELLPVHSCGMIFKGYVKGQLAGQSCYYSVGGGSLADEQGRLLDADIPGYEHDSISEVLTWCRANDKMLWEYVSVREPADLSVFLGEIVDCMYKAIQRGVNSSQSVLPGGLNIKRRARKMRQNANRYRGGFFYDMTILASYALAVSEENASGSEVVTAPTCGACGVLPAVMYYMENNNQVTRQDIYESMMTAGLFGSSIAQRASISGAEVGCQGEVGSACAMAAAAAAQLLGGTNEQVEYAAEMALEHMLGLTCDPVAGLVQVPCIERNAFAAQRALECACYALATAGEHFISFDDVTEVMNRTGRDLQAEYRETSRGGLAGLIYQKLLKNNE
ncbi:MAG: L-serine ammonia-lyase, iron-sulfur-dependent, subunit alpha [Sedimentisphaerales bacterium]|nr:L-serine ammonia-lyase, iron-sulfur-dependent, subunit alpha [Sedimentisphaerales bacterium]